MKNTTLKTTSPQADKSTLEAVPTKLLCGLCSGQLEPVLEPQNARQNPRRLHCVQPSCKAYGKVWLAPIFTLAEEP